MIIKGLQFFLRRAHPANLQTRLAQSFGHLDMESDEELRDYSKKGSFERVVDQRVSADRVAEIMRTLSIPRDELVISYCRSSGPGGQHVNKTDSKAVVKFNVLASKVLNAATKRTVIKVLANRINKEGDLIISNQDTREQNLNLNRAIENMRRLLAECYTDETKQEIKMHEEDLEAKNARIAYKKKKSEVKKNRSNKWE